jgi:acyl-CoA ligase (AMP-forming) (exosortase A-associated)
MTERLVHDLLWLRLATRADHPALVLGDERLSYAELARRSESLAAWLWDEAHVRPGDRVAISLHKGFEEVIATFAVTRIGAVFVNVNHQWTAKQLEYVLADCGARVLVTERRKARELSDPANLVRILLADGAAEGANQVRLADVPAGRGAPVVQRGERDLAALLYTSGSTGRPKGVMLSHRNIVLGAHSVASYLANRPEDRILGLLPMSFDYGMNQLMTMLLVGGTLVLQPVVLPAEIVKSIQERGVTGMALVPPSWVQLVRYLEESRTSLPTLRYATNSGGKIPRLILEAMPRVLPGVQIFLMYGLTEAFRSSYLPPAEFQAKLGAIGRAIPGAELFVVHPEKGLCAPGEEGELVHRGELISLGYWNDPERTNAKIKSSKHLAALIGDEKVLFSGDLVHRDEDGCLWFHGRMDEMIKCSGFRLSPTEVEDQLYATGLVGEAIAYGVEDDELGQVVHVAVTAREVKALDPEELLRLCRKEMPGYMVPRRVHLWPGTMPRTSSGKLDRATVIQACKNPARSASTPSHA